MTAAGSRTSPHTPRSLGAGHAAPSPGIDSDQPAQRADRCRFPFGKPAARLTGAR